MLGSAPAEALNYSAEKLLFKYSNRCEKCTSTSQTDGQADGQTIYDGITALCVAARSKNFGKTTCRISQSSNEFQAVVLEVKSDEINSNKI